MSTLHLRGASLSIRCSHRHHVLPQCHLAERARPHCHRHRQPHLYSCLTGVAELHHLASPLSRMNLTKCNKPRARLLPLDTSEKAREASCKTVWAASYNPTSTQARSHPVQRSRGNTDGCIDARSDTSAVTTCRVTHVRVLAKGSAGSAQCSMTNLIRRSPWHHTHKSDRR